MDDGQLRFDAEEARIRADVGMSLADQAARVQTWKLAADLWLDDQPHGREVVADDLTRAIGVPSEKANNVVGAWFNGKARKGRLVNTGRWRKSERVSRHANQQRVWSVVNVDDPDTCPF